LLNHQLSQKFKLIRMKEFNLLLTSEFKLPAQNVEYLIEIKNE